MTVRHSGIDELPSDVREHVRRRFSPGEADAALAALAGARIHTGAAPSPRLLRCAVVAAQGSLASLRYYLDLLAIDWRDVIVAGEYEPQGDQLVRTRDLDQPIPELQ